VPNGRAPNGRDAQLFVVVRLVMPGGLAMMLGGMLVMFGRAL
jgi:hypothetical protein